MQQLFLLHTITFCKLILFPVIHIYLFGEVYNRKPSCYRIVRCAGNWGCIGCAPGRICPVCKPRVTEMLPGGSHSRKKGQITDDTLQAMAVAESLAACRGFNQNDLIFRLLRGYEKYPEWYGPTSSAFFELVKSGTLPHKAAWLVHKRLQGSRSNGSVMRGFPVGIFYSSSNAYEVSLACSQLTHFDLVPAHCSAWLNVMVSDMCRGISRDTAFCHARSLCHEPGSAFDTGKLL